MHRGRRKAIVAPEGIVPMVAVAVAGVLAARYLSLWFLPIALALLVVMFLVFRDPRRRGPSIALGVVCPTDGEVVEVEKTDKCVVSGDAYRIRIRIDPLGTYTARSPVEGKILNLHSREHGVGPDCPDNALWVQTDEGENVVLQFHGYRLGLPPRAIVRYGERVGQGQRCAYLRLARFADVFLPFSGKVLVKPGQRVIAGSDVIGSVPHP